MTGRRGGRSAGVWHPGRAVVACLLLLPACATPRPDAGAPRTAAPLVVAADGVLPDAYRAEVHAGRGSPCPLLGTAVHLGGGRFLTAAHLVDGTAARMRRCEGADPAPSIRYGGEEFAAVPVRVGRGELAPGTGLRYLGGADLALLQVRAPSAGPAARPCGAGPEAGQAVVMSSRLRTLGVLAGAMVPEDGPAWGTYADIPLPLVPGESGAGVFDARTMCLLGIVSHREDASPDTARAVTAATIRRFLGASPPVP